VVRLLGPYIIVQPVTGRGSVESFLMQVSGDETSTSSQTCRADVLDTSRLGLSRTRQPIAAFPAVPIAMGALHAPHLLEEGELRTVNTLTMSGEGQAQGGAVGWEDGSQWR
jgi:hypothetical protein